MNVSQPDRALRVRSAVNCRDEQARMQRAEVESAVKTVGEGGQISCRVFSEVERMVAAGQTSFEIAEHGVDPMELGQVSWFSSGHDGGLMRAPSRGDSAKAGQSIGKHRTSRGQARSGPVFNRLEAEARYG